MTIRWASRRSVSDDDPTPSRHHHSASSETFADSVVRIHDLHEGPIRGLNLVVGCGETLAIVGRSGSGKSTLVRCVLGLSSPRRGHVVLCGIDTNNTSRLPEGVGACLQDDALFDWMSVRDNLLSSGPGNWSPERIESWLVRIGLTGIELDGPPSILSGGQRRRVSVLRGLIAAERLLVLDEPDSGLDPFNRHLLQEAMRNALMRRQAALLLITHDHGFAENLCERVLTLVDGQLHERPIADGRSDAGSGDSEQRDSKAHPTEGRPVRKIGFRAEFLGAMMWGAPIAVATMALLAATVTLQMASVSPLIPPRLIPLAVTAALFQELAPLLVGMLLASRLGASFASQVGGLSYTSQLEMLRLLGRQPRRLLLIPFAGAAALSFPLCIVAGALGGLAASSAIASVSTSINLGARRFFLVATSAIDPILLLACGLKGALMGFAVAGVAYWISARPVRSASALGTVVTWSVVAATLLTVLVDVAVSFLLF